MPTPHKLVSVNGEIPEELHTKLKVAVAQRGRGFTMRKAVIEALRMWVGDEEPPQPLTPGR